MFRVKVLSAYMQDIGSARQQIDDRNQPKRVHELYSERHGVKLKTHIKVD